MILVNFQAGKGNPKARVDYLLFGTKKEPRDKEKVDVLEGNARLFLEIAKLNRYKTTSYNLLVSFVEDKKELEEKLKKQGKTIQDVYNEFMNLLVRAFYDDEELNIFSVGHSDTDNYHFHITIDSRNQLTDTQLYFEKTRDFEKYMRLVEKFVSLKYQVSLDVKPSLRNRGRAGVKKIKQILKERGEYREQTRDEIKEEITNILAEQIGLGAVNSREELIDFLESIEGLEITRAGKNYITIKYGDMKVRLKGGIYDERRFDEIKREITSDKTRTREDISRELERVSEELKKLQQELYQRIEKRFRTARERAKRELENSKEVEPVLELNDRNINWDTDRLIAIQSERNKRRVERGNELSGTQGTGVSLLDWGKVARGKDKYMYYSTIKQRLLKMKKKWQEKRQEELKLIKSIPPKVIFVDLGIDYEKEGKGYKFRAFWRGDKNPSISVSKKGDEWLWHDFGTNEGGSWIDLYMKAKGWDYITTVRYLRENFLGFDMEVVGNERKEQGQEWELLEVKEKTISRQVIKQFLEEERQIKHIPGWLREIEYELFNARTGEIRKYFGFGVKDQAGNYHIRFATSNSKVKERVLSTNNEEKSTYTLIKNPSSNSRVVVVEGFIDGIRAEELGLNADLLILNGVENISKALDTILKYYEVYIATDMDNAGEKVANEIKRNANEKQKVYRLEFGAKDLDDAVKQGEEIKIENISSIETIKKKVRGHRRYSTTLL